MSNFVLNLYLKGKNVIVTGLLSIDNNMSQNICSLISLSEKVEFCKGVCDKCNNDGTLTTFNSSDNNLSCICKNCYYKDIPEYPLFII